MDDQVSGGINRRQLLASVVALAAAGTSRVADAARVATPRQTAGPFYPIDWSGDIDWDLVRLTGEAAQALGTVTHLSGRVTDLAGVARHLNLECLPFESGALGVGILVSGWAVSHGVLIAI